MLQSSKQRPASAAWHAVDSGRIEFEDFLEALLAKLPGAVRLESCGPLLYAKARNGARRLVGCCDGIAWPLHSSRTYDILRKEFVNFMPKIQDATSEIWD